VQHVLYSSSSRFYFLLPINIANFPARDFSCFLFYRIEERNNNTFEPSVWVDIKASRRNACFAIKQRFYGFPGFSEMLIWLTS